MRLTSARDKRGATQAAEFSDGRFVVTQRRKGGRTRLKLSEPLGCPRARGAVAVVAARRKGKRRLWGDGKGKFETVGRRASAAVTGTRWLTEDTCAGTRVRVASGVVRVRDLVRNRTVRVRAGGTYFARNR